MFTRMKNTQIDDCLDLYLLAKRLRDSEWQEEIRLKLAGLTGGTDKHGQETERALQEQFVSVNRRILYLYRQIRELNGRATDQMSAELFALKHRRIELGKEIDRLKLQNPSVCK
ncbi:hypothetical protein M3N64_12010 [Sporolactobacillus sp. CPB3-1]|uniref:Uncharacterized protein n=1 Tax=Sporolactobacillus mangiferae TaxID=2940498 RepID=A0ABT0MCQ8_9BACL|nr:hypothetical protein [Sporolactobacillus mangiferae]MCL1632643.1 hypothetical protein [Sporolactobacillus mangiferae]